MTKDVAEITSKDVRSGKWCRIVDYHRFAPAGSAIAPDWVTCIHCGYGENQPKALRIVK